MGDFFDEDDGQYRTEDWEAIVEAVLPWEIPWN